MVSWCQVSPFTVFYMARDVLKSHWYTEVRFIIGKGEAAKYYHDLLWPFVPCPVHNKRGDKLVIDSEETVVPHMLCKSSMFFVV